jgi:hypothetical protein
MSDDWKTLLLDAIDADPRKDRAISLAAGLGPNFVGQLRGSKTAKGKRPNVENLRKLAREVGLDASSIMLPEGDGTGVRKVAVKAYVQAGAFSESWEWPDEDGYDVYVQDLPELAQFRLYAAETRGPSMNRRWNERTVVVFTDVQETMESPIPGKRYVVERQMPDGTAEHTVKLLHQDQEGRYWLMPESDDPRFQAPISVEDGVDGETIIILGRVHFAVTRE